MGHRVYRPPQDSPTFVRIPLTDTGGQRPTSCCGEASKPSVDYLTNKWNVFLDTHIPQPVFEAMMQDIYNGPKFQRFLSTYYSPAGSACGLLLCLWFAAPCLLMSHSSMRAEVGRKISTWNKVLTQLRCGVTMQINEHGLIFNISPQQTVNTDDVQHQLFTQLGLKQY